MAYPDATKDVLLQAAKARGAWISVHNADPGKTGANVVSTARVQTTWAASPVTEGADRVIVGSEVAMPMPAGSSATHFGVWTLETLGEFVTGGALDAQEDFTGAGTLDVTPKLTAPDPV